MDRPCACPEIKRYATSVAEAFAFIERVRHSAFVPVDVAAIEAEREKVRIEFNNLTRAIAAGGDEIPALARWCGPPS